jgi:putative membrane protein
MKSTRMLTAIIGASALIVACNADTRGRSVAISEDSAVGTSGTTAEADARADASAFARDAAMHGNAEVQLGELAAQKGQSADVKQFGQMMVKDHTMASDELKSAVKPYGIQLPADTDAEHKNLISKLGAKSGAEFDREYIAAMVSGHEKAKDMLEDQAAKTGPKAGAEMAVAQWASKALPTVERHLAKAKQIRDGLK